MRHSLKTDRLSLGVCYYPEHWSRELWQDDLRRMKEYGIETVRVAEFSWNLLEPEEGRYTFDFWDDFLALAEAENMKVIFCTPTATPPAWLTQKYPEVLNADGDGHLIYHGLRRHYTLNSDKYLELCDALISRMAEHFNKWDCIIGWQLDNEVNCEISEYYSQSDHEAFRRYMKEKYRTLDELNDKMGTAFWSQTYTDWEQLHLARRTTCGTGYANPHLQLEQVRFISHSAVEFLARQARIIRPSAGERFITTNGIFGNLDYQALMEAGLDFIMYDNYPNFNYSVERPAAEPGAMKDRNASFNLARVRKISEIFGIMEQQSGPGGWNFRMLQPSPKPGQMRLWTLQAIAHGADFISYFRWRTCSFGTEIYWHGLNDYSNRPNRRLEELKQISADINRISDIAGKPYQASVGIITDYDNEWDGQKDNWHGPLENFSTDGWFKALQKKHIPFDFVDLRDSTELEDLKSYSLLVYPHASILTEKRAKLLKEYTEQGGKLVMGCRTGYKDIYGRCPMRPMPGPAADICGVEVSDFTFAGPDDEPVMVKWGDTLLPAPKFNDILTPVDGGIAEGTFTGSYFAGQPALVTRKNENGQAWYFGGCFAEETAAVFLDKLGIASPTAAWLTVPEEAEEALRGDVVFVLNYENKPCEITLACQAEDILSGKVISRMHEIEPYGAVVLRKA